MSMYQLQPCELAGLEKKLRVLRSPKIKKEEPLNKKTFELVSAAPKIIAACNDALTDDVVNNNFLKKGRI